jgi:Immunoglobulin I-set domain
MEKKDEFFSLLVFKDITARHSGKYTCYATNSAAKVNYTAELFVKGMSQMCNQLVDALAAKLINFKSHV